MPDRWTELAEAQPDSNNSENDSVDSSTAISATTAPIDLTEALRRADPDGSFGRRVQTVSLACCACGGLAGAMSPFLLEPISSSEQYSLAMTSLLAAAVFIGMWIGSFVGGLAADWVGPGKVMVSSVLGLTLTGAAPAAVPALAVPARLLVGLCLCTTYQASNTYVAESVAIKKRSLYLSALHVAIAVGGLLATALAEVTHSALDWRALLLAASAPPLLVSAVSAPVVQRSESPRWLLVNDGSACRRLLLRIARSSGGANDLPPLTMNSEEAGKPSAPKETVALVSPRERWRQLVALWRLHAFGSLLSFCLNFASKGPEAWMGVLVEELGLPQLARIVYFCQIGGKIVGDVISMYASHRFGRLRCLQAGFIGSALCTLGFVLPGASAARLLLLAFGLGVALDVIWCSIYIYLTERLPTTVRSTGFGVAMGVGRAGGVLSAAVGGITSSKGAAFLIYSVAFAVGAVAALQAKVETVNRPLVDMVATPASPPGRDPVHTADRQASSETRESHRA